MAERSLSHLNYGHPGIAIFDLEKREWNFSRQPPRTTLQQVRPPQSDSASTTLVLQPTTRTSGPNPPTRRTDAFDYVKRLAFDHPEIVPAAELLPELAVTSSSVLTATTLYDPLIGDLFSVGVIPTENLQEVRRVAAAVTGECGNVLRLIFFCKESQGWSNDRTISLKGETLKDNESGFWNEEATPIQQVCFAQSPDRSSLLAVRLPTKTTLFRPMYTLRPSPARRSPHFELPLSRIDPHPILTLNIEQSGGSPHADVTFNPDFQLQFAVVDQSQTWSVWDIDQHRKSNTYSMSCLVQGKIIEDSDLAGEDGWGRVLWIGDINTILVCNRRHLSVISIQGGAFIRLVCPVLIPERSADWILDVKSHPSSRNCFFVLTSLSLFLMAVTTVNDAQDATRDEPGAQILVSWSHYRGGEDFTLRMSVQMLAKDEMQASNSVQQTTDDTMEEIVVLLHSRLNSLLQVYSFHQPPYEDLTLLSSSDPGVLELVLDGTGHIINLSIELLNYHGDAMSKGTGSGYSYFLKGLTFYKLFVSRSDYSVHETILCASRSSNRQPTALDAKVDAPLWNRVHRLRSKMRKGGDVPEMDNFIIHDGIELLDEPVALSTWPEQEDSNPFPAVAEFDLVYEALTLQGGDDETSPPTTDVFDVSNRLMPILHHETNSMQAPLGTVLEFAGRKIDVADVDEASRAFHEVLVSGGPLEARHIASAHALNLAGDEEPTIASLYDSLLQNWVAPLPQEVPIRNRQQKERLARRVAAEVFLGSTRIRQRQLSNAGTQSQPSQSQDGTISLPILSSQPPESSPPVPSFAAQPLPLLPLLATQSSSQVLSSRDTPPVPPRPPENPLLRLNKHLRFRDDVVEPVTIAANVSQLLTHWQPGSDPQMYDWEGIERALHNDNLDDASQEQKEKEQRRKARREKKQQRENELLRSQPSSQTFTFAKPTVRLPRSSPGPLPGGLASSSQVPTQTYSQVPLPGTRVGGLESQDAFVPQSQIEPGRYGGRLDKKKKKKRLGGF